MKEVFLGRRTRTAAWLLAALALRLFLALTFPNVGGDSPIYEAFATNLLHHGVYSHAAPQPASVLAPSMIRTPGYPIFLAAIFAVAGDSNETAVRVVQAFLDTFTVWIIALIVLEMAEGDAGRRQRLAHWALLLAALCPFIANYAASILAETPTTFFLVLALWFAVKAFKRHQASAWFLCGLFTGVATMFRPESGLWLLALAPLFIRRIRRDRLLRPSVLHAAWVILGLILPLAPWTLRNGITFRTFQPLAPPEATDVGEFAPQNYWRWCKTWLWEPHEIEGFAWPVNESPMPFDSLPGRAFDNAPQKTATQELFQRYDETRTMSPELDAEFAGLARQRIVDHPWRYYLELPALRALALWFTPRREILPLEGRLWPIRAAWSNDPRDFLFTLLLFVVNLIFVGLALAGMWRLRRQTVWLALLLILILSRTIFLAYFTFPEPRYVLEAYPAVLIFAAFAFAAKPDGD